MQRKGDISKAIQHESSQVVGVDEIVGQHGDLTDYRVKVDSRQIEEAHFSGAPT